MTPTTAAATASAPNHGVLIRAYFDAEEGLYVYQYQHHTERYEALGWSMKRFLNMIPDLTEPARGDTGQGVPATDPNAPMVQRDLRPSFSSDVRGVMDRFPGFVCTSGGQVACADPKHALQRVTPIRFLQD